MRWAAVLFMLVTAACAPAVPDLTPALGDSAAAVGGVTTTVAASVTTTRPPATTTTTTGATTAAPTTTTSTTTTTTTTTTTAAPPIPPQTVGEWTVSEDVRDESGVQFAARISVPALTAPVDQALLARVGTLVEGHVQSEVGATLALWRSIEGQGERDLTGSTLNFRYEVAAFVDEFISLRFFSDEQVADSGGAKRQVTTLMIDLDSGIAIGLDDVIASGESRVALLALVEQGLLSEYFEGDQDAYALWAGDLSIADLNRALLTADGLEVWFDELEVGPPDIGVPVVLTPYSALGGILDPAGPGELFL